MHFFYFILSHVKPVFIDALVINGIHSAYPANGIFRRDRFSEFLQIDYFSLSRRVFIHYFIATKILSAESIADRIS